MTTLPGRLGTLQAAHIMTKSVTVLRESETLSEAIAMLRKGRITGAPVVNDGGKLIGILSITDIIAGPKTDTGDDEEQSPPRGTPLTYGEDLTTWNLFERAAPLDEAQQAETVGQRMTPLVTTVTLETPLVEVARVMCGGHWHRVPVVDEEGTLCGIVSTMDLLAAVVNTADEPG